MSKEYTKIFISFKSKKQIPLFMIYKLYYATKEHKKNNEEYWGKVLVSSDNLFKKMEV